MRRARQAGAGRASSPALQHAPLPAHWRAAFQCRREGRAALPPRPARGGSASHAPPAALIRPHTLTVPLHHAPHFHPPPRSGWLSSAVLGMMAVRLGGWLFGLRAAAFEVELTLGLVVFATYVIFDTQVRGGAGGGGGSTGGREAGAGTGPGPGVCALPQRGARSPAPPPPGPPRLPHRAAARQVIVERCGAGDFDNLKHALDLFVDLAAVFAR